MVTETTANALQDVLAGRLDLHSFRPDGMDLNPSIGDMLIEIVKKDPVIDVQAVYDDFIAGTTAVDFYETELRPPWMNATWVYENRHGNVMIMCAVSSDSHVDNDIDETWESKADTHTIDWDRVRWRWIITFWVGGKSKATGKDRVVAGPLFTAKIAVYEDGSPADIAYFCMFPEDHVLGQPAKFETELGMLLKSVDIANCRNVEMVPAQPGGDRASRRRTQRALGDVRLSTLSISPQGKSHQGPRTPGVNGTPLTSVRGHVAHYGACCPHHEPKGLLFGKYTARVWVPSHERGDESHGENRNNYSVTP